jgi:hypothetical protein
MVEIFNEANTVVTQLQQLETSQSIKAFDLFDFIVDKKQANEIGERGETLTKKFYC